VSLNERGQIVPNAPLTGWSVVSQQETFERDASGQVVPGVRVYYQLTDGPSGSVFLPRTRYNPVNVRAEVAAAAAQMREVHNLSG
jgi:hypothetical protein